MKNRLIKQLDLLIKFLKGENTSLIALKQLRNLSDLFKHYTPTVYLTIHKGMIVGVHSTEKVVISIQNRDNLKDVDNQDVGVWEHMIEQGLNSGELISIKLHK